MFAGSEHIENVIGEVVGDGAFMKRLHLVPPGVNVRQVRPLTRGEAIPKLLEEAEMDQPNPLEAFNERLPDEGNAARLATFLEGDRPPHRLLW